MILVTLHLVGPGFDMRCVLADGEPELVLGRDPQCDIALPETDLSVSRRHLALWTEQAQLHYRVLSSINGITVSKPAAEQVQSAGPGTTGVAGADDVIQMGEYRIGILSVVDHSPPPPKANDPWAALQEYALGGPVGLDADAPASLAAPLAKPPAASTAPAAPASPTAPLVDPATAATAHANADVSAPADPFSETWAPVSAAQASSGKTSARRSASGALLPPEIAALFDGMGISSSHRRQLTTTELEDMGRVLRVALLGLIDLHASTVERRAALRADDHTMLLGKGGINPLTGHGPSHAKMLYLLGTLNIASAVAPRKALLELLAEISAHESASQTATRALVAGTLKEFAPDRLKTQLLQGKIKSGLFEKGRLWDLYCKYYQDRIGTAQSWQQQLIDRHFVGVYTRLTGQKPPAKASSKPAQLPPDAQT